MSTSNPAKMHLRVKCEDSATEIFIIDGRFNLRDRGIGHTETELEPGIYKVKVRAGFETSEQHVIVRDQDESLTIPHFSFVSPAPLDGTAKTHEFHMAAAERGSTNPDLVRSGASSIFIFSRDWTSRTPPSEEPANIPNPGLGLSLRQMNGDLIADLTTAGKRSNSWEPWVSFNVSLEAGCYRLTLRLPQGESIEQTLVACDGWQTQVFLLQSYYGANPDSKRADLQGASIQLAPLRLGFKAGNPLWRLSEFARLGLSNERKVLSEDLREILVRKFDNPMLGLYGAHLLLLEAEPDMKLLDEVVNNLHDLLPSGHPDLSALDLFLKRGAPTVFDVPPMLRKSWTHIVNATAENPQIVPPDSLAAEAALHQWGGGPWLLWLNEEQPTTSQQKEPETKARAAIMLSNAEVLLRSRLRTASGERQSEKTDSPFAAISKLRARRKKPAPPAAVRDLMPPQISGGAGSQTRQPAQLDERDVNHLVQSLCIPKANLERIIKNLETNPEEEMEEN